MNAYSYIESLFKSVLQQSKAINGRFYILPKGGQETNTDEFDQVMALANDKSRKFPVAVLMPPVSSGMFFGNDEWETFNFQLFFLNTTFYTGANQGAQINPNTQTSSKKITQEWDEMKVAAVDFVRVMDKVQRGNSGSALVLINALFRMPAQKKTITPITFSGNHRLSGVRLEFTASLFLGCDITDYAGNGNEIALNI